MLKVIKNSKKMVSTQIFVRRIGVTLLGESTSKFC